jgi:hypothetical protein
MQQDLRAGRHRQGPGVLWPMMMMMPGGALPAAPAAAQADGAGVSRQAAAEGSSGGGGTQCSAAGTGAGCGSSRTDCALNAEAKHTWDCITHSSGLNSGAGWAQPEYGVCAAGLSCAVTLDEWRHGGSPSGGSVLQERCLYRSRCIHMLCAGLKPRWAVAIIIASCGPAAAMVALHHAAGQYQQCAEPPLTPRQYACTVPPCMPPAAAGSTSAHA